MKEKLIVVEGAQGAGKTTVTDYLRHTLSYTNLYRLSGTADSSPSGKAKSREMYNNLLDYLEGMQHKSINLVFDRTFFTDENYCRLGKKEYIFTDVYNELLDRFSKLDFDIYYITLYLKDESEYKNRLGRKEKALYSYARFDIESSINQQKEYLNMAKEIKNKYPNIKVIKIQTDKDFEEVKKDLHEKIGF